MLQFDKLNFEEGVTEMEELMEAVLGRIFVPLEASGRHVHLTEDQANALQTQYPDAEKRKEG